LVLVLGWVGGGWFDGSGWSPGGVWGCASKAERG
jgi:hypothetical protein